MQLLLQKHQKINAKDIIDLMHPEDTTNYLSEFKNRRMRFQYSVVNIDLIR